MSNTRKAGSKSEPRGLQGQLDSGLKITGMAFLWELGYVVRPEVLISEEIKSQGRTRATYLDVTDVDVVGYRFSELLSMETACIDCGCGKSRAPMDRAFWLRGLKEAVSLDDVICVTGRRVEEEHRFAALRFGVQLVESSAFEAYIQQILGGPTKVDFSPYYNQNEEWASYLQNFQGSFYDFLRKDNWQREWNRIPVTVPGQLRRWTANLNLDKELHRHGLLELGLLLSIGLTKLAAQLFKSSPSDFPSAVRTAVLGGDRQTKVIDQMVKLIEELSKERSGSSANLFSNGNKFEVPHLSELLDILDRMVTKLRIARLIPHYIQAMQIARVQGSIAEYRRYLSFAEDPVALKLALDVFRYLRIASESKEDFSKLFGVL